MATYLRTGAIQPIPLAYRQVVTPAGTSGAVFQSRETMQSTLASIPVRLNGLWQLAGNGQHRRLASAGDLRSRWQAVRPQAANSRESQRQRGKDLKQTAEVGNRNPNLNVGSRLVSEPPSAPSLVDSEPVAPPLVENLTNGRPQLKESLSKADTFAPSAVQIWWRRAVRQLSSFPLAVGILFAIAGLSSLGTVIEQGESLEAYMQYYPEDTPLFGFFTWRVLTDLSLDHIYTAPYFLGLLLLLAFALVACTSTRQWPMVRVAQRWSFFKRPEPILKMEASDSLPNARVVDLATLLAASGYEVFLQDRQLYAFKGLLGRIAPIGVHAALLLVMGGGLYSAIGGYRGASMTPEGSDFFVGDAMAPNGALSSPSDSMDLRVRVNEFFIEYRLDGQVKQFFSDLTMVDLNERDRFRKIISVNEPLRYQGVTIYQTDWGISAVQLRVDDADPVSLPMASLNEPGSNQKLFGTFLPLGAEGLDQRRGISILARDLQNVVVYDLDGNFVGVRRPGSGRPITVNGVKLEFDRVVGSTGLEIKMDPSVPYVYAGFGALMLTSAISYLSHAQIWALEEGSTLYVGGKSNRARLGFKMELDNLMDLVPEVVPEEPERSKSTEEEGIEDVYAA